MPPRKDARGSKASKASAPSGPAPSDRDQKLADFARQAAELKKKQKPVGEQLKEGFVMLIRQFIFLGVAIFTSYTSQLALAPVYGEIGAGIHHTKIATVAFIVGWAAMSIFEHFIPKPILVLAVMVGYAPQLQTYLFRYSEVWGAEWGPVYTEALTTYPIIFMAAFNGAQTLKGSQSGHMIPGIACFRLFQTMFTLLPYQLGEFMGTNYFWTRCGMQSVMAGLTALVSGTTYAGLVLPAILHTNFYNPRCTWNGGSTAGKDVLTKTLAPLGYTLLERQESITGYLSVLESSKDSFRVLRCDHSILGGEWQAPPAGYEHLAPKGELKEPIYAVFVMLEAVRLVEPQPAGDKKNALVIGLGIGTSVNGLISHGVETEVVEIDPAVHALATKHFGLKKNHTAHLENALDFVTTILKKPEAERPTYSYILHDVFTGGAVPPSLFTKEFIGALKGLLKPDGVIAINFAGDLNMLPAARVLSTIFSVFENKCRIFREDEPQGTAAERAERDFTNIVIFCLNPSSPSKSFAFRRPEERDYLGTLARRKFLVPTYEVEKGELVGRVAGGEEVITVENADGFAEVQRVSGVGHWSVMRKVLPVEVWENY